MRVLPVILALIPLGAVASPICEPIGNLSAQVSYCDENVAYVAPARKCFQAFKALVDAENAKIQKALNEQVNNAKGTEQAEDFATTQAVLASANTTLTNLIDHGKQVHTELEDYAYDLVLPLYDAYPEDYNVDPWSKEGQKMFREKQCYGEPMEDLDAVKAQLRPIIADLEKTKAKVVSLHKTSGIKKTNLDSVNPVSPAGDTVGQGSARGPSGVKGKSKNSSSTITGVEENKKKSKKVK